MAAAPRGRLPPAERRSAKVRVRGEPGDLRAAVRDIAAQFQEFARTASGGGDGLLHVFVPRATAGAAVIELGAGNDVGLLAAACLLWAAGQLKVSA